MQASLKWAILIALLLLYSCRNHHKNREIPLAVEVVEAKAEMLHTTRSFISTIGANYSATIQPRIASYLTSSSFENGMPVKRGQLLFTLDDSEQRANRLAAEAELSSARAKAVEARRNYERAIPLARINAISQTQLDQYTAENVAAKAAVNSSLQNLANARLAESYTKIYSPIDGIISSSNAHIGDYVGIGTQFATLTTIQNIDTVSVDLALPMNEYLTLSGKSDFSYENSDLLSDITLTLADGSRYPLQGFYKFTRQSIAGALGTIIIVVGFHNPNYALKDGQFARINARIGSPKRQIVVPQQAISQEQNIASVWVIRPDSTAEFREVKLGGIYGSYQVIDKGVNNGEVVALTGGLKLKNGAKVTPKSKSASDE
ncbi:MAG: efflux RND transporter periplasmic adaptor subunit [Alistipes sp.]|nr:efflux RND transporter periplasmic adaptor subunit [Alistipes sp.]